MHHDLGLDDRPDDDEFDDFILHVDGWLCEIKDAQIRDGLHVLGQAPAGEARVNLVLAMLRAAQVWGGQSTRCRVCGRRWGVKDGRSARAVDASRSRRGPWCSGWTTPTGILGRRRGDSHDDEPDVQRVLQFAATAGGPAAGAHDRRARRACCTRSTAASSLPGRRARRCAAWSTCCPPAATSTPSTRRPCRPGWPGDTGQAMADSLVQRYLDDTGDYPRSVGLSVWGTSAMRTSGDDIAEVLALIGVRPVWDEASRRVTDLRRHPARGARPAAHRRHRADLRLLPGRLPARRRDARRRRPAGRRTRRAGRAELRPRARRGRPRRARRRSPSDHADLRLQARLLRRRAAAAHRVGQLARRRRPRRGLHGLGRLRLRSRAGRRAGRR